MSGDGFDAPVDGTGLRPAGRGRMGVVVAMAVLALVLVGCGDGSVQETVTAGGAGAPSGAPAAEPAAQDLDGTLTDARLRIGDCLDYEGDSRPRRSIDSFVPADCAAAHRAEVAGMVALPDTAALPSTDELVVLGEGCDAEAERYLGAHPLTTDLVTVAALPDQADWDEGARAVTCLVETNGAPEAMLTGPVAGAGTQHPAPGLVPVSRMQVGACFDPAPETTMESFDLYQDEAGVVDCAAFHRGLVFGRVQLHDFGADSPYPGDDAVMEAVGGHCQAAFHEMFGQEAPEATGLGVSPDSDTWSKGDRLVVCVIADERGLPPVLDFAGLGRFLDLPTGACYDTAPGFGVTDVAHTFAWVEVIECGDGSRGGYVFGRGELDPGPYPGAAALNETVGKRCSEIAARDGVGPVDAPYINFGFTTEEQWATPGTAPQFVCHVAYGFEPSES